MSDCLILNADGTPLSLVPLKVVKWQSAMRLLFLGKAKVLKEYDHWVIRSQYAEMKVPSIIIMTKQVKWLKTLKYSSANIYLRDDFTCQLQSTRKCTENGGKTKVSELTLDHVVPRSRGGKTNWTNCCTACKSCNSAKGNDEKIVPKVMPKKPTYFDILKKRRTMPIQIRDAEWKYYIDWPDHLVTVLPQPGAHHISESSASDSEE